MPCDDTGLSRSLVDLAARGERCRNRHQHGQGREPQRDRQDDKNRFASQRGNAIAARGWGGSGSFICKSLLLLLLRQGTAG